MITIKNCPATVETAKVAPTSRRRLRSFAAPMTALLLALGIFASSASPASAWVSPTVFNTAQCNPSARTITQSVEVSTTNYEYVELQGAVVRSDGAATPTGWYVGQYTGRIAAKGVVFTYPNVARGQYSVWMRYRGITNNTYWYSGWFLVSSVSTTGTEWTNGISFGSSAGCSM